MDKTTLKWFCGKCVCMLQTAVTKLLSGKENGIFLGPKWYKISNFFFFFKRVIFSLYFFQTKTTKRHVCLYQHIWFIQKIWKGQRQHLRPFAWLILISSLIFWFLTISALVLNVEKYLFREGFSPWVMGVEFQKLKCQSQKYSQS